MEMRIILFLTFSRQTSTAVNVEWRSSRVGVTGDRGSEDKDGGKGVKLSGEKHTKKGLNLRWPSLSG